MSTDKTSSSIRTYIALALIIVLQLGRLVYSFVYLKEDYHSDEIWSYGLSNSYYEPFIYQNAEHTDFINYKTWFSSQVMRDYLTVDKEHRFSYGSVYYNQVHDYHPPFYYFILHTICSFFPGKFSVWYSLSINIFSFICTIYFLYKLVFEVSHSEKLSLLSCIFYGFSIGAFNTFVFIRIYALATMISTMYLYFHAKLFYTEKFKKYLSILFVVTLIGSLTHHFFIPFAGCVAACFCVYYLIKKKYKKLLIYSVNMLSSVVASVLIFPATIDHLFSGRIEEGKYPFMWQIKLATSCMTSELFGISISPISKYSFTANLIAVVCILVIISPLAFLFRKEEWFKKALIVIKNTAVNLVHRLRHADLMIVSMLISTFGVILLTALTVSYIYMAQQMDRYVFIVFPGMIAAFVMTLNIVLRIIKFRNVANIVLTVICACFCAMSNMFGPNNYLFFKEEGAVSVKEYITDSNCIFISDQFWLMTCFTRLSMDADHLYALTAADLKTDIKGIDAPPNPEKQLYIYIDDNVFYKDYDNVVLEGEMPDMNMGKDQSKKLTREQFETQLLEKYKMCKMVGFDNMFMRRFLIYKVN